MLSSPVTPIQSRTLVQLYRTFLRLGKRFDEEPNAKSLIYRTVILPRLNRDNHLNNALPSHPFATTKVDPQNITHYFNEVLDEVLEQRFLYLPPSDGTNTTTANKKNFQSIIRHEFHRSDKDYLSIDERIDTAFALLRKFSMVWGRHKGLDDGDVLGALEQQPNETREHHPSTLEDGGNISEVNGIVVNDDKSTEEESESEVEILKRQLTFQPMRELSPGMILAAHPMLTGSLHRTVILLLEHSTTASYGIVLNRPTSHTLSTAVKNLPQEFVSQFGPCKVSFGGMVRRMQWIHPYGNCGGTLIPNCSTKSLYAGGMIHRALSFVRKHPQELENFKFFVGCCCWGPGQLEEEMDAGYWISAVSQPDRLLELAHYHKKEPSQQTEQQKLSGQDTAEASSTETTASEEESHSSRRFSMGREIVGDVDIYQVMLDALGHDYQKLADIPSWLDSTMVESCDWQA